MATNGTTKRKAQAQATLAMVSDASDAGAAKRKPTHGIYNVTGDGQSAVWHKVGAAWLHRDGKGFGLSLEYLPRIAGGRLVIRAFPADATS